MNRSFLIVDWGNSRLRSWIVDPDGVVGAGHESERGIAGMERGDYPRVFRDTAMSVLSGMRSESGGEGTLDVYFSGMVTSDLGWFSTSYLPLPAGAVELARSLRVEEYTDPGCDGLPRMRMRFLPGLRVSGDVLRGEEIEAIGVLEEHPSGEGWLVLPGTHSKWIRYRDGRLLDFVTVPTGDLHGALHRDSVISRTLPESPVRIEGELWKAFDAGVASARERGGLSSIFRTRSLAVLDAAAWPPSRSSAFLSGALIGGEIAERLRFVKTGQTVLVGGAEMMGEVYMRAFALFDESSARFSRVEGGAPAIVRGVRRLRQIEAESR